MNVDGIEFLGEQDGVSEREFKSRIFDLLERSGVSAAFLARVQYDDGQGSIALCLKTGGTGGEEELVQALSNIFGSMFNPDASLDILFLTSDQEQQIRSVCEPFFECQKRH